MSEVIDDTDEVSSTGISSYVMMSFMHCAGGKSNLSLKNPDNGKSPCGNSAIRELADGAHDGGMAKMVPDVVMVA